MGLANSFGVNGGVQLWHLDRVRALGGTNWTEYLIRLTHEGSARAMEAPGAVVDLRAFGILQEQDLVNLAIIQRPHVWRPLDCVFNYLPKTVFGPTGGHITEVLNGTLSTFVDRCVGSEGEGTRGTDATTTTAEEFGCSCGRKVRVLHFVGRTKSSNPQAPLLFQFWGHAPEAQLLAIAAENQAAQDDLGAGNGAVVVMPLGASS